MKSNILTIAIIATVTFATLTFNRSADAATINPTSGIDGNALNEVVNGIDGSQADLMSSRVSRTLVDCCYFNRNCLRYATYTYKVSRIDHCGRVVCSWYEKRTVCLG